jgi:hypothetical protein
VPHVGITGCLTFKFFSDNSASRVELKTSNIFDLHTTTTTTPAALAVVFKMLEVLGEAREATFSARELQVRQT